MAPLSEEQLDKKREDRQNQIMQSAIKVFVENGYRYTKMGMIAKEAKVSHGLVYHYFSSKEEVLHESLKWAFNQIDMKNYFSQLKGKDSSAIEKIREFTLFAFSPNIEMNYYLFRLIQVLSSLESTEEIPEQTKELYENTGNYYMEELFPLFVQGQEEGDIVNEDPEKVMGLYFKVLSSLLTNGVEDLKEDLEWSVNRLLKIIQK